MMKLNVFFITFLLLMSPFSCTSLKRVRTPASQVTRLSVFLKSIVESGALERCKVDSQEPMVKMFLENGRYEAEFSFDNEDYYIYFEERNGRAIVTGPSSNCAKI